MIKHTQTILWQNADFIPYSIIILQKKKKKENWEVTEAYSEPSQAYKMEFFAKIVKVKSH